MQAWFQFYAVTGAAAATLLGLLFVAVSFNAQIILGPGRVNTRRLAEQAFQSFFAVLVVSLLALFPEIAMAEFGFTIFCLTAASAAWVMIRLGMALARPNSDSRLYLFRRYLSSMIGFGTLLYSAIRMSLSLGDNRNLLAISIMVLLASATLVSWGLLIRISQSKLSA